LSIGDSKYFGCLKKMWKMTFSGGVRSGWSIRRRICIAGGIVHFIDHHRGSLDLLKKMSGSNEPDILL
jgi:hypothetical protein